MKSDSVTRPNAPLFKKLARNFESLELFGLEFLDTRLIYLTNSKSRVFFYLAPMIALTALYVVGTSQKTSSPAGVTAVGFTLFGSVLTVVSY